MKAPLPTTRRAVLAGSGAGLFAAMTAACSVGNDYVAPAEGFSVPEASGPVTDPDPEDTPNLDAPVEEEPAAAANALATLDDIPVGTAKSVKHNGKDLIISRVAKAKVTAFSATCTHQGCPVKPVGKSLDCPCHGAKFDYATGEVTNGPAEKPLTPFVVRLQNGNILPGNA